MSTALCFRLVLLSHSYSWRALLLFTFFSRGKREGGSERLIHFLKDTQLGNEKVRIHPNLLAESLKKKQAQCFLKTFQAPTTCV